MAATVREVEVFPICMREFDVLTVEDVTPGMRRVTLGGPSMDRHVRDGVELPAVCSNGFDDDIKLLPVDPGTGALPFEVPRNLDNGTVDWPSGSFQYSRTYTVRRFDAAARELVVDFAAHKGGLASEWAYSVQPGEKILVAGPKHSSSLPKGVDWILIAGDETALPAIAHCLEKLPADLPATVVIEVAEPSHRQELSSNAEVDVSWLYRSGVDGQSRLVETVQNAPWRPGQPYLWVAGEASTIKPLRRWAKHDRELAKQFVEITGYWRYREQVDVAESVVAAEDPADVVHEMSELLPPVAIRTAVTVGLFAAVDAGADTAAAIAAECATDPRATGKLLRHLTLMELLSVDGDRYALTDTGSILADQDTFLSQALHFDKIHTRLDMAFLGLLESVRTGTASVGHGFADKSREPGFVDDFHEESAFGAVYRAPALPDAVDFDGVTTVAIYGEGGGVYADTLVRLRPELRVAVVGLPAINTRNLTDVTDGRRDRIVRIDASEFSVLPEPVDVAIVVDLLDVHPDADAQLLLRAIGASSARTVLITDLLDPATTDDHDTESDLLHLCLYGTGRRTEDEVRTLISETGCGAPRFGSLGWGSTVVEFSTRG
ncbi:siderophore-interacting protein [Rhodococcoides kyotonense]|uniref:NADPH-dependent ferric siderophore reductase, contains FAD-binding and SIP domains n=1 Tax=Rhodococcoides kyotonense TaxID=398843 RepID=A0A239E1F0_9NOCA|nr:siderophore-interacting protein [Rhodococcus kyotonensis]SNS38516.1 NADPH-dependent ferric siderophore reductase, contains FAD-binding and SIP domains [Rhodococcus kyotonensis]